MAVIYTRKGQAIEVDDSDFEELNKRRWHISHWGYAESKIRHPDTGKWTSEKMHRVLLGLPLGDPREGDHWDNNKLNNRRKNLRVATSQENKRNMRRRSDNTSGFKGVHLHTPGRWRAKIKVSGKNIYLGLFDTPEEAHVAYCKAAEEAHVAYCKAAEEIFKQFANKG